MTIRANHDSNTEPLRLRATRMAAAGKVEQRLARGRPSFAVDQQHRNSPIRAWRAADPEVGEARQRVDSLSALPDDEPTKRHPAAPTPTGPRPHGADRTVRMRAIEQAWKAERARQAECEAAERKRSPASTPPGRGTRGEARSRRADSPRARTRQAVPGRGKRRGRRAATERSRSRPGRPPPTPAAKERPSKARNGGGSARRRRSP
jgi:hypothetical protein